MKISWILYLVSFVLGNSPSTIHHYSTAFTLIISRFYLPLLALSCLCKPNSCDYFGYYFLLVTDLVSEGEIMGKNDTV